MLVRLTGCFSSRVRHARVVLVGVGREHIQNQISLNEEYFGNWGGGRNWQVGVTGACSSVRSYVKI